MKGNRSCKTLVIKGNRIGLWLWKSGCYEFFLPAVFHFPQFGDDIETEVTKCSDEGDLFQLEFFYLIHEFGKTVYLLSQVLCYDTLWYELENIIEGSDMPFFIHTQDKVIARITVYHDIKK
jgi:hypothetical protein